VLAERYTESNGALKKDVVEAVEEALRKPRAEFARPMGKNGLAESAYS
jgi:hypothetical protein